MKPQDPLSSFVFSKPPPSHIDLEEAVLGAILSERDAAQTAADVFGEVNPFYLSANLVLYEAIYAMHTAFRPIDILTVTSELKKTGKLESVGGRHKIVDLTNRVASAANLEYHCRIIFQDYIQREIIRVSGELIGMAYDETTDVFNLLDRTEGALSDFGTKLVQPVHKGAARLAAEALAQADSIRTGKALPGLTTGFSDLDKTLNGLVPGEVYIVAGRPGMGKTAFVTSLLRRICEAGTMTGFFSLEMSAIQLTQRLISQVSGIELGRIQDPRTLDPIRFGLVTSAAESISRLPFSIDDTGALSIAQMKGKARAMRREGCKVLIVDYIQLMGASGKNQNREQEIGEISRGLKAIAKELQVPVIALSQLSRAVETRGGSKRPQLSDLRESGSIEQDAYCVMFLYRPEYYGVLTDNEGNDTKGAAMLIVAKNRNGALDDLWFKFNGPTTEFTDFKTTSNNQAIPAGSFPDDSADLPF